MLMKVLVIQHVSFETPGYFLDIFEEFSGDVNFLNLYETKPDLEVDFDVLLIMGGPMNIYEEKKYPWLIEEKEMIKKAISDGKIVIGICLGAQLIADVMGSKIYKNEAREIGWFPVQKTNSEIFNFLPEYATVFHWHGETFNLPDNCIAFYRSEITENQAFLFDNRVLGLQFHLEMTEKGGRFLCDNCKDEMDGTDFVMSEEEIIEGFKNYRQSNHRILKNLMKWLFVKNELIS
jgi:GMP synthase-like glutamine amidotransferase